MKLRILMAVAVIFPTLVSCGEYKEYSEPDQAVIKKDYPIPPEYQEEYQALVKKVTHYHEGSLPEINETHARAHSRIGLILFKAGDLQKARENLDRSLNMDPDIPETHQYLGEVLEAQGQHERAIGEYEKALNLNPNLGEVHRLLAETYEKLGLQDQAQEERKRYEGSIPAGN